MDPQPDIDTFTGDLSPDQVFNIVRGTSGAVDLTGATVNFLLFNPTTKLQTNTGNEQCLIQDAVHGRCIYIWGTNDKPTPGIYRGYIQIEFPGARPETSAVRVNVQKIGF